MQWSQEAAHHTKYVWARRSFDVTPVQAKRLVVLRWNRIACGAEAFINGQKIGENEPTGPYQTLVPAGVLTAGKNQIVLKIRGGAAVRRSRSGNALIPAGFGVGMPEVTDDVWIDFADTAYMKWVLALPDLAASRVKIRVTPTGVERLDDLKIVAEVKPWPNGETIGKGQGAARLVPAADPLSGEHFFIDVPMPGFQPWTHERCPLYIAKVKLAKGERLLDEVTFRFGMREIGVKDRHYQLNGKRLWLRGSNLVFEWNWGGILTGKEKEYLVTEAREMSMNSFRTHTHPTASRTSFARWRQRTDVLLRHHQVVPPDLACTRLGSRHVAVKPNRIDVQFRRISPREAGKKPSAFERNALALLIVPGDALLRDVGLELVVGPGADRREALSEIARDSVVRVAAKSPVKPVGLLAVGVANIVHLDHGFQADPLLLGHSSRRYADLERVPPSLPSRRAPTHILPVAIEVPTREVARLNLAGPSCTAFGSFACSALGPRRGRMKTNQPAPVVVNGRVFLVEFHVEAEEEPVVAVAPFGILEPAVEIAPIHVTVGSSSHSGEKERLLATAPQRHVVGLGHDRFAGHRLPMTADLIDRALERLHEDHVRITFDARVARILGSDASVALGKGRSRLRLNRYPGRLSPG